MAYKILINSKGVPVLVQLAGVEQYEREIALAVADESKHIAFKDDKEVYKFIFPKFYAELRFKKIHDTEHRKDGMTLKWETDTGKFIEESVTSGQTFDIPENIGVSFEAYCEKCGSFNVSEFLCGNVNCKQVKLAIITPKPESVPSCGKQSDEEKYAKALAFKLLWSYALSGRRITKFEDLEEYATEWFEANGLEIKPKAPTISYRAWRTLVNSGWANVQGEILNAMQEYADLQKKQLADLVQSRHNQLSEELEDNTIEKQASLEELEFVLNHLKK